MNDDQEILLPTVNVPSTPEAPVPIVDAPPVDAPISIAGPASQGAPLSPEFASPRAYKFQYGMNSEQLYPDIYNRLVAGDENKLRQEVAANQDKKKLGKAQQDAIAAVTNNAPPEQIMDTLNRGSQPTDPASVMEDMYAERYMQSINWPIVQNKDSFLKDAYVEMPKQVQITIDMSSQAAAKHQFAQTTLENAQEALKNQSWVGFGVDLAKELNPLYDEAKLRGITKDTGYLAGGLLGSNLYEQSRELLRLPYPEYKEKLTAIIDKLKVDNPSLAVSFAQSVAGKSSNEVGMDNAFSAINLATAGQAIKGGINFLRGPAKKRAELIAQVQQSAKDIVDSSMSKETSPAIRAEGAGDVGESAVQAGVARLKAEVTGVSDLTKDALDALPTALQAGKRDAIAAPGRFGQSLLNILEQQYNTAITRFSNAVNKANKVERIPLQNLTEGELRLIKDDIKNTYPGFSNAIMDVQTFMHEPVSNTYHAVMSIGRPGGELWTRPEYAIRTAAARGFTDYTVEQKGAGFFIQVTKPVNETTDLVRNLLVQLTDGSARADNTSRLNWVNAFIGKFRTPDEVLSKTNLRNRKTATFAPSVIEEVVKREAKYIEDLARGVVKYDKDTGKELPFTSRTFKTLSNNVPKAGKRSQQWEDFVRTLEAGQNIPDPVTGIPGYFFKNPQELENFYQTTFHRLPTIEEHEAYFAYKRIVNMDHGLRNLSLVRDKLRLGTEAHSISRPTANGLSRENSAYFDGIKMNHLPNTDDGIYIAENGTEKLENASRLSTDMRNRLNSQIEKGSLQVVRIYDPEIRPLNGFSEMLNKSNARVRYVVTDKLDTQPISWKQLKEAGGGHFDYDYDHYIKQAKIHKASFGPDTTYWYEGDKTLMPVANRAMATDLASKLNQVRILLRAGDEAGAELYNRNNVRIDWDEVKNWFHPTKDVDGNTIAARLDLNEPLVVVPKGGQISGINKDLENRYSSLGKFRDGTKSGSDARQFQTAYTSPRDAYDLTSVKNTGTQYNPIYKEIPAEKIDAISAMNRAMSRIIQTTWMNDYKISSVESWIREAAPYLDATESELRSSPFYHFNKPSWKPDAPKNLISQFETQKGMIQSFTGIRTPLQNILDSAAQTLADGVYNRFGPGAAEMIKPAYLVDKISNPASFIRSMVFHEKLGLFNIPQILVQNQTYSSIYAIAGAKYAVPGTHAAFLHSWGTVNPTDAILTELDRKAAAMNIPGTSNWKVGEFKEAYKELINSGFGNTAGKNSMQDAHMTPTLIKNYGAAFLDAGQYFFNAGERSVKYGAYYTAFKEFRDLHPTGMLTVKDKAVILDRADLLAGNMSRASSSILHTGPMSLVGQFLSYSLRQAELFTGSRIDNAARARLLAYNAAIYGAPTALGVTGLPFGDNIRQYALENGYIVGNNWLSSMMAEGIPSYLGYLASGTHWNVGSRYGNQGMDWMKDLVSDGSFMKLAGGAAIDSVSNTFSGFSPYYQWASAMIRQDQSKFPLKIEDFIQPLREIPIVNSFERTRALINTGEWLSKNGVNQASGDNKVSVGEAIFMGLTGLNKQPIADITPKANSDKEEHEYQKKVLQGFMKDQQAGLRVMQDNPSQARDYFARAQARLIQGGFPEEKWSSAYAQAAEGYEDQITKIDQAFYLKNVNENNWFTYLTGGKSLKQLRLEAYEKQQKLQQGNQ